MEDTPATVGIPGTQALSTGGVLLTTLHWYHGHLADGGVRERLGGGWVVGKKIKNVLVYQSSRKT